MNNYLFSYSLDSVLLHGIHCHYNFEKCGEYLINKEKNINKKFDYIIYVRPDLFFYIKRIFYKFL